MRRHDKGYKPVWHPDAGLGDGYPADEGLKFDPLTGCHYLDCEEGKLPVTEQAALIQLRRRAMER